MKLIGPYRQLLTMAGLPLRGPLADAQLQIIEDAGILLHNGAILAAGKFSALAAQARTDKTEIEEIDIPLVGLPGFIDAHTHICFAGSRAGDYALRNAGNSYLEIAKAGGGIWDTVSRTREATQETLVSGIAARAGRHLRDGITTIEVKSGYGLSVDEELKMLRAIREASGRVAADLVPTCLAAHMVPRDFSGDAAAYLDHIGRDLLPKLLEEGLCRRIDAFIEEGAFTREGIAPYFTGAKRMGFSLTVHADQFTVGGSEAAIAHGAVSADHLEASTAREVAQIAGSNVIATALPGASLGLGCSFAPARALLNAGAALAIASDWNPGSAPMGRLLTQAAILGTFQKLTGAEVFAGVTFRAAAALQLQDRGRLEPGQQADMVGFATSDYREILYRQGSLAPARVWKNGKCVYN
jgi:imidazolonepropionase